MSMFFRNNKTGQPDAANRPRGMADGLYALTSISLFVVLCLRRIVDGRALPTVLTALATLVFSAWVIQSWRRIRQGFLTGRRFAKVTWVFWAALLFLATTLDMAFDVVLLDVMRDTIGQEDSFFFRVTTVGAELLKESGSTSNGGKWQCDIYKLPRRGYGVIHGELKSWYANGNPEMLQTLYLGMPHGPVKYWYKNGQVSVEGQMHRGLQHGWWVYWYENGQKAAEGDQWDEESWRYWNREGYPETNATRIIKDISLRTKSFSIVSEKGDESFRGHPLGPPVWQVLKARRSQGYFFHHIQRLIQR